MNRLALALILSTLTLAGLSAPAARAATPTPLSAAQQHYLALAQAGVSRAEQRWDDRRLGWYDARLTTANVIPLATIWDIVPLFESLDAIAIAEPTAGQSTRGRALRRGRRALPEQGPAPAARLLALP